MKGRSLNRIRRYANNEFGTLELHPLVTKWSDVVIEKGGLPPSLKTQQTLNTFIADLDNANLLDKMYVVNCIVPDNLTASITPIIRNGGFDIWRNFNFVESDLTVNGLKGNGSNKYLDTGITPNGIDPIDSNGGLTIYKYADEGRIGTNYHDSYVLTGGASSTFGFQRSGEAEYFDCYNQSNGRILKPQITFYGYISGNRGSLDGGLTEVIYHCNEVDGHLTVASSSAANTGPLPKDRIVMFAANSAGTVTGPYSPIRYSFFAIHQPLLSSESDKFCDIVAKMRMGLGGGYLKNTVVTQWADRATYYSGMEPSASTVAALQIFYDGLISNNLLSKMKSVNCFVPDNLSSSMVPLINYSGYDIWHNSGFVPADLTINGLKGDGGKYLRTGTIPSNIYNTNATGGISIYNSENNTQNGVYDVSVAQSAGQAMSLYLSNGGTTDYWDCYNQSTARISGATTASFLGYTSANVGILSGSITRAIYIANSTSSHRMIISGSAAGAGTLPTSQLYVFANGPGGDAPSSKRYSFVAIHDGLTPEESSNLFNLVQAMRMSFGGGYT